MPTSTSPPPRLPSPIPSLHPSGQLTTPQVHELTNQLFNSIDNIILPWFEAHLRSSYSTIPEPRFRIKELAELMRDHRIRLFPSATVYREFETCISIRKRLLGCYVEAGSVFGEEMLRDEIVEQEREVGRLEEALAILKDVEEGGLDFFGFGHDDLGYLIGVESLRCLVDSRPKNI
ncbi:hypothetical protein G7Y79_00062g093440 [Physcia stellaris]|nr:hypothetical protein G7Y79_00062g093440 [Physcia stellaris]